MHTIVSDDHPLYRRLAAEFCVASAKPAPRAAFALMAALRVWTAEGHAPVVALCADVCHEVVAAVLCSGCTPVFLDLDPATGVVSESEWLRGRAAGASVALVVHLYGNPVDLGVVRKHFPYGTCLLIDDAAQALGARNDKGLVGGQGDIGLLSFGATKHIEGGGAAILVQSPTFAEQIVSEFARFPVLASAEIANIRADFRRGLEHARAQLRAHGDQAAVAFQGLLENYAATLAQAFPEGSSDAVLAAFDNYNRARVLRIEKAAAWAENLADCGLLSVRVEEGAVPWRYTCRLPGSSWDSQHRVASAIRAQGIHVSHWYLPAHWMCGAPAGSLPGVEQLAREVFQFWVDDATSLDTVRRHSAIAAEIVKENWS